MSRTVELGRAVISSQNAKFELWLTTLITVSQQQESVNLHQLGVQAVLDIMSSGDVWVGRDTGMYLALNVTIRGEPLTSNQLQWLAESIISAPVSDCSVPATAMLTFFRFGSS